MQGYIITSHDGIRIIEIEVNEGEKLKFQEALAWTYYGHPQLSLLWPS